MSITLRSGELECVTSPESGVPILSIKHRGYELLAPASSGSAQSVDGARGISLLAPWANRLRSDRYSALDVSVDLAGLGIERDVNFLPLHGTLVGRGNWIVLEQSPNSCSLYLDLADDELTSLAFPFAALMHVDLELSDSILKVVTTVVASGQTSVPACFGWHPYFQISDEARQNLLVRFPTATRVILDSRGLPTNERVDQAAIESTLGTRLTDDLLLLGDDRDFVIESTDRRVSLHVGAGYEAMQIWIPEGERFICVEPMVASVAALSDSAFPIAETGRPYSAEFSLEVTDI